MASASDFGNAYTAQFTILDVLMCTRPSEWE